MEQIPGQLSKTGVRVANDFRDNLIIDRYDEVFVRMRASKIKHLRSENSEDAVTWNVFRSLRQIDPSVWLPELADVAHLGSSLDPGGVVVTLWVTAEPPASLLASGDEGDSEIDIVIESPSWVWFIEAKYRSDVAARTTMRPDRDQLLRNIDVGSYYAGVREFFCSLLIDTPERSPRGAQLVEAYRDLGVPRRRLATHRPDGLRNCRAVTLLTWRNLAAVLRKASRAASRDDECGYAERALNWLQTKGLSDTTD